jgi:GT2 family glycosyltransferase
VLHDTVISALKQTHAPTKIIVCVPELSSVRVDTAKLVQVIQCQRGLTVQRNVGLEAVETEYTLFLDDDIELAPDYFEVCLRIMECNRHVALIGGWAVVEDVSRAEALQHILCQTPVSCDWVPATSAYGCNMFVRTQLARCELFDEELPLYGWLEDYDWSMRISRHGQVAWSQAAKVIHLRTRSGRSRGDLLGYSQIANPLYLWRKGVMSLRRFLKHWAQSVAGNIRRQRTRELFGNLTAFRDLILGRIHPTRILSL